MVFRSPALDYRIVMLGAVLPVGEPAGPPRLVAPAVDVRVDLFELEDPQEIGELVDGRVAHGAGS